MVTPPPISERYWLVAPLPQCRYATAWLAWEAADKWARENGGNQPQVWRVDRVSTWTRSRRSRSRRA